MLKDMKRTFTPWGAPAATLLLFFLAMGDTGFRRLHALRGRLGQLFRTKMIKTRQKKQWMQEGSQFDVPFDTKRILQHFDTAHKVEFDIFKRPSFSFQKCNPGLYRNLEVEHQDQRINNDDGGQTRAYPHLSAFNFPFITVAFVSPPFCLEEVENRREGEVLATLRRRKQIALLLQLLLLWLRLLLNLLLLTLGLLLPGDL